MSGSWPPARGAQYPSRHQHQHGRQGAARTPCLYEMAMREAIAIQHRLSQPERYDLRACEDCGQPYLLASIWQPISESGVLACPRCGAEAVSWDGAHGYLAYWHRGQALSTGRAGVTRR